MLNDPELEPVCRFCTDLTVEALVPGLAVAVVAADAVFAKSSMCTRLRHARVTVCTTNRFNHSGKRFRAYAVKQTQRRTNFDVQR